MSTTVFASSQGLADILNAREKVVMAARLVAKRMARESPYTAKCVKELMAAVDKLEEVEK